LEDTYACIAHAPGRRLHGGDPGGRTTGGRGETGQAGGGRSRETGRPRHPTRQHQHRDPGELESLPGLGPKVAERILEYRQKNGTFKKVEEILETSRSGPYLLTILPLSAHRPVARTR
jgi:competence protein ComEA